MAVGTKMTATTIVPRELRPYQLEAVAAVESDWDDGYRRVGVVLATGLGKSTVGGKLISNAYRAGQRVLVLAHRAELLDQFCRDTMAVDPNIPEHAFGHVRAEHNDVDAPIVFATLQTLTQLKRRQAVGRRDVIIWDECFVAGTSVDGRPIESLRPGDYVTAVDEIGTVTSRQVTAVMSSTPSALVRVTTETGEQIVCTPRHPFLTEFGWLPAWMLPCGICLHHAATEVHDMRSTSGYVIEASSSSVQKDRSSLLLTGACKPMAKSAVQRDDGENKSSLCFTTNDRPQSDAKPGDPVKSVGSSQALRMEAAGARRKWASNNQIAVAVGGNSRMAYRISDHNARRETSLPLQDGHCASIYEGVRRSGRPESSDNQESNLGQAPRRTTFGPRVASVSFLKPGRDGTYGGLCPGGMVYNLEVDTDHTYTVGSGIVVHNCHHAPATGYHATFRELGGYDSALMCGLTATMARADAKADQVGVGDVIEKISYERDLQWAIENGYLVKPSGLTVRISDLNKLNEIPNVAGDFNQGRLAEVMEAAVSYTVDAIEKHARDRQSIVFAASVRAAHAIAQRLNDEQELRARAITGEMSYNDRLPYYRKFREGKLDVLVTVAVLTEGADFPRCDCVVIARPTRSPLLYSQMVGRALRPFPNKDDALVLDLSGVTAHMKLVNLTDLDVKDLDLIEVDTEGNEVVPEPAAEPKAQPERIARDGVVDMMPVDLFGYGHTLWLRTPAGVSFMPLPDQFIAFIWPYDGNPESTEYAAGWLSTRSGLGEFVDLDEDGKPAYRPMATAIAKASKWAQEAGHQLPVRKAGWRSGSRAPSDKQLRLAAMLAIPNAARMSRGRVSDEISIAFAARWLDRRMKAA